ncbi:hypothetical protein KY348_07745 [Candidatus Woesearchaeota archaeon]|nr:hypothetical protein [Candidatus Woesearchaeota archaeon]
MIKNKHYIGIFLVSVATLMLEIGLIRLLSVIQFYHFAFLIVSIALFGSAAAGTFLYIKKLKKPLFISAVLFSVSSLIGFFFLNSFSFDPVQASVSHAHALRLILYYIFLGLPFFFSGIIIAYSFASNPRNSGKIYFYNLLGAALGSLGALLIISLFGEKIIFIIFTLGLLSSAFFTKKTKQLLIIALISLLLLLIPTHLNISDYKELSQALNYPNSQLLNMQWNSFSRVDVVKSSFTRYAPGLSSEYRKQLPEQIGVLVDASNMNSITQNKNLSFVDYLPTAIGYSLMDNPKTLIINAGAGLDVLAALESNASVTAVETNPLIINLLKNEYKDFSGGIYTKADVHTGEGRSFIKQKGEYDIIILSLAGNVLSQGLYGLSENYLLTAEAFKDYHNHLTKDGVLIVTRWLQYPPRESLRLFSLALEIDETGKRTAMFRSWTTVTLLLSKKEFDENRINQIKSFTEKNKFDIIYLPAEFEPNRHGKFKEPYYYQGASHILENKKRFYKNYLFDVSPVYDDKPFYFNFFKPSKAKQLYNILGQSWQPFLDQGFLLIFLLAQAIILSLIFILLPLKFLRKAELRKKPLAFFFCIGIAYLFIEIVLIQKFILLFGQVIYSVSTVIFSMLLFSSIGSLVSQRLKTKNIFKVIIILFILIILYYLLTPLIINSLISLSLIIKIILTSIYIAPLGFFMGMPFPLAIKGINKKLVPWAWATNGSASVLSPILAVLLALVIGYSAVLILAALFYLTGIFFFQKIKI